MIPKLNHEVYKVYIYKFIYEKDGTTKEILNDIIFMPENIEKYRIPHEIASDVELRLRADMLTEEEREQAKQEEKTAYNKGLTDAWEVLRKLQKMPCTEFYKLFPCCEGMGNAITELIRRMTPAEAIAKIKAYEKEQKEIKVGDEVYMDFAPNETGIVTLIYPKGKIYIMWEDGTLGRYDTISIKKTGRHFPQIEGLLKAMKGENP